MSAHRAQSFFTIANLLSLARPPLGLLFAVVLVAPQGGPWAAFGVLALAGLTDALDGMFARKGESLRTGGVGRAAPAGTGSWLDPICDKVFAAIVLTAIWFDSHPPLKLLGLILAREVAQLPLAVIYAAIPSLRRWLRYDFRASALGKAATVAQFAAITALLFKSDAAPVFALVSFAVGLLALGDYLGRAIRISRQRRDGAADPNVRAS
jgi:phosphatidylglycerophosphate synthase